MRLGHRIAPANAITGAVEHADFEGHSTENPTIRRNAFDRPLKMHGLNVQPQVGDLGQLLHHAAERRPHTSRAVVRYTPL